MKHYENLTAIINANPRFSKVYMKTKSKYIPNLLSAPDMQIFTNQLDKSPSNIGVIMLTYLQLCRHL